MSTERPLFVGLQEVNWLNQKVLEEKKQIVQEIKEKVEKAQGIVLVDYRGLTVEEVTQLRRNYRKAGVEYKVYKNTLMRFAFKELGLEDFNEYLKGPSAIAFGYDDPVQPAKVTNDFAKEHEALEIKAGIVDGKIVSIEEIKALANLPSKEVLIAQVLGGFNAPIAGFVNVLQGTIRSLVYALNAIKEKQEAQGA